MSTEAYPTKINVTSEELANDLARFTAAHYPEKDKYVAVKALAAAGMPQERFALAKMPSWIELWKASKTADKGMAQFGIDCAEFLALKGVTVVQNLDTGKFTLEFKPLTATVPV